jgi:hypothetical protein
LGVSCYVPTALFVRPNNFRTAKARPRQALCPRKIHGHGREELNMDYLVALGAASLIALYAFIVSRCLPKS